MTQVELIYTQNFLIIELLLVACFWYLALVTLGNVLQYLLEERMYRRRMVRGAPQAPLPDAAEGAGG
jgi:polar amino acid transport system permease protein